MKHKIIYSILVGVIIVLTILNFMPRKSEALEENKDKVIKHENTLSMMIEQTAGTGDYKMEERTSWPSPKDGYSFNTKLSKCENGGELGWDSTNNVVTMTGNMSDKCYIYFDILPNIDVNFVGSTSTALKINVLDSDGELSDAYDTFYYSVDGGATYVSSSSNTYSVDYTSGTISNLSVYASVNSNKSPNTFTKKIFNGETVYMANTITCSDDICGYNGVNKDYGSNTYSYSNIDYTDNMNGYLFNNSILMLNGSDISGSGSNDYYIRLLGYYSIIRYGIIENFNNLYIDGEFLTFDNLEIDNVTNIYFINTGEYLALNSFTIDTSSNIYISASGASIRFENCVFNKINGIITFNLNGIVSFSVNNFIISGDTVLIKVTGSSNVLSGIISSFEDLSSDGVTFLKTLIEGNTDYEVTTLSFDFNGFTFTLDEAKTYINSLS